MMLHTKYQGSSPCGFGQGDLFMFFLYKPMFENLFLANVTEICSGMEPFEALL